MAMTNGDGPRDGAMLDGLYRTIASRHTADPKSSYTAELLRAGPLRAAKKLGEEAVETILAAAAGKREEVIGESADLLYHLLVLWAATGVTPLEVWTELARREGVSGLAEKAARPKN
jgi:phosphoribosyl-ATP pyrophosphohydrolase